MAVSLKIENKGSLLKKKKVLTKTKILNIIGGEYEIGFYSQPFNIFTPLNEEQIEGSRLAIINYRNGGRGLEFYIDQDSINIGVLVPTINDEIRQAEHIAYKIGKYVGAKKIIVDDEVLPISENIIDQGRREFILSTKHSFDKKGLILPGMKSYIYLKDEDGKKFSELSKEEFVVEFEKFITDINVDAYNFNLKLYNKTNENTGEKSILGIFSHTRDVASIIPKTKEFITSNPGMKEFLDSNGDLEIFVMGIDYLNKEKPEIGTISYEEFLNKINPYILKEYDREHYLIEGLSLEGMESIYK